MIFSLVRQIHNRLRLGIGCVGKFLDIPFGRERKHFQQTRSTNIVGLTFDGLPARRVL